jgi:hypothetical protein
MVVTLELMPEVEQRIIAQAALRGVSLEAYLKGLIEAAALVVEPDDGTVEEFEADMDAFSEGTEHLPVLPPEAFTREGIYGDHD